MQEMTPVRPIRPAAGYIGGKRNLAGRLVPLIEAIPHRTYAEPFVGMGGVFFRRRQAAPAEVINDFAGDVATLFRVLQRHYVAFLEMMRYQLTSRREFERLQATDPSTLTDLERAARFLYLQRTTFGGKVAARTFGVDPRSGASFDVTRLVPVLEAIHERLAAVTIESLPWRAFLDRYDRPETLFYLDPPYYGSEADYGRGLFSREEFPAMAARLKGLRGHFVLSLNDLPEVREIFAGFTLKPVRTSYSISRNDGHRARELIITGGG